MKGNSLNVKNIAKDIRKKITCNVLKSGTHLSENTLAKQYKISRVPVREALRILQSEGYVDFIPNKGCFVKKISKSFIRETTKLYSLLAPVVLDKAIPNYTEKTYSKAETILQKIENSKNFDEVGCLLWDFALVIYSPSNMKFMIGIFEKIYKNNIRILNELFENKEVSDFKIGAHREFVNLCKEKRSEEAIRYWSEFISQLEKIVLKN